jgi:hypothetical protein
MNESEITKRMVTRLKSRGAWARKIHGSMYTAGLPDIIVCYKGWCLGLEVKKPGREKTLTGIQRKTLERIEEAGGYGKMVTTIKQVDAILDEIDGLEDA